MSYRKRKYPLRRIVGRTSGLYMGIHFSRLNLLECGHAVPVPTDIYGDTAYEKQRCRLCFDEKKPGTGPLKSIP